MMIWLTSTTTILALLWHSLAGCCWHHVHEIDGCQLGVIRSVGCHCRAESAVHEHDHSVASCEADSDAGEPLDDHGPPTCDEPDCSFVGSRTSELTAVSPPVFYVESDSVEHAVSIGVSGALVASARPCSTLGAPKVRAALQIWVV